MAAQEQPAARPVSPAINNRVAIPRGKPVHGSDGLMRFAGFLGPALIVLAWQLVHSLQIMSATLLPSPAATAVALYRLVVEGQLLTDLGYTFARMGVGYAAACAGGVLVGLVMGSFGVVNAVGTPVVDFFRSVPVTTLYPVFVLVFGVGHASKVAMVFMAAFWIVALNTAYGAGRASRVRLDMARLFGASRIQVVWWVRFYDALPQTLIGLRVGLSYALIVELLCEMFMGSQRGLGQRVTEAYTTYVVEDLFAIILLAGLLGYILNRIFLVLERKLVPWVSP